MRAADDAAKSILLRNAKRITSDTLIDAVDGAPESNSVRLMRLRTKWQTIFRATDRILYLPAMARLKPIAVPTRVITPPPLPQRDRAGACGGLGNARLDTRSRRRANRWRTAMRASPPARLASISRSKLPGSERAASIYLADRRQHMEVVAVREPTEPGGPLLASVFVPTRAENYYLRKIEAYRDEETASGPSRERSAGCRASIPFGWRLRARCSPTKSGCFPRRRMTGSGGKCGCAKGVGKMFERVSQALEHHRAPPCRPLSGARGRLGLVGCRNARSARGS